MDYEKAYKAVLKTATQWIKDGCTDKEKICLECVFPELRESEDERIRKEMIAYFAHRADVTEFIDEGEDCKRWISYLEKQKEQKPIDYPYLPGWRKNRDNNKPELKRSVLMLTTHGVAEGEWLGEKWCQYRWSCELKDGEVLYWIHLSDLERLEKEGEEKQKEQKPNIELIQRSWYMEGYHDREFGMEPKWIIKTGEDGPKHELNPKYGQPLADEQNPAGWSEEDADILNCCISSIEEAKENRYAYKETDGDTSYDHEIAWLKSLRPSWKPSDQDELMKLKYAGTSTKLD